MASVMTLDFLKREASRGRRADFARYLRHASDAQAQSGDEWVWTFLGVERALIG